MKYLPLFLFIAACGDSNDSIPTVSTTDTSALVQTTIDQKTTNYKKLCVDNNASLIELDRQACNAGAETCTQISEGRLTRLNNIWDEIRARADAELRLCIAASVGGSLFNEFCLATTDANTVSDIALECDAKTF